MKNINLYITLIFSFSSFAFSLMAQQMPGYNQHLYSPETFNPARLGKGFIALGYRQQYLDLGTSSPTSYFFTADLSHALKLTDKKIGLGISLQADQAHIINRNQLNGLFSYHLIQGDELSLSAGISAGVLLQQIKFADARVNNPFDLAIYDASESQTVFDGGPALSLLINPGKSEHHFALDASLPQLFSSDINYRSGQVIADLQPHLQVRAAYRYQSNAVSIEPLFMYRDMLGTKKVSAAGMDAALKVGFLEDKIWLGAGMRLNAETYHFTGGVNILSALNVQAGMELHSQLGNSIEIGLLYQFGVKNAPPTPPGPTINPVEPPVVKIDARALFKVAVKNAGVTENNYNAEKTTFDEELIRQEKQAELYNNLKTYNEKLERLTVLEAQIPKLRNDFSKIKAYELPANEALDNSKKAIEIISNLANRDDDEKILNTRDMIVKSNISYANRVDNLDNKLKNFRATLRPEIVDVITLGNNERIRDFFQKRLNELPVKPRDLRPLKVESINNKPVLVYQFSNGVESYDMNKNEFADIRGLMEHIIAQINDIKANRLRIAYLNIFAQLRDSEQQLRTPAGTYKLEMGNAPLNIAYQFYATPTTVSPVQKSVNIRGAITVNDLSILKIYSMRKYFESKSVTERLNLEQSILNRDQGTLQIYTIRIYLEK